MKVFGPPRRELRSPDYSTAIRGKLLTDKQITHYIRRGYYGEERRARLAVADKRPKHQKKPKIQNLCAFLQKLTK